jgi:hypothetical protein
MVVACLALFVASTGTSIAAKHYLITSTKQIKPSVLKKLKGNRGPRGYHGADGSLGPRGLQGAQGLQGAKGDTGAEGEQGSDGIVETLTFSGGSTTPSVSGLYFVGNTATVTLAEPQRITGTASTTLSKGGATYGDFFDYGLCYQGGWYQIMNRFGGESNGLVYTDTRTFTATGSTILYSDTGGYPVTYKIGFCINNNYPGAITTGSVNGWVLVTN